MMAQQYRRYVIDAVVAVAATTATDDVAIGSMLLVLKWF